MSIARNFQKFQKIQVVTVCSIARSEDAPECVVVASDKRLLRAAEAEGLQTLNPETVVMSELIDFIN